MNAEAASGLCSSGKVLALTAFVFLLAPSWRADAKQDYRDAFFNAYPSAIGTVLDGVPSRSAHCGVCHYRFNGGGTRNPYGQSVSGVLGDYPKTLAGRTEALLTLETEDPDGDNHSSLTEITHLAEFNNTPTFPGLTPGNLALVQNVTPAEIEDHLVPQTTIDVTPPVVTLLTPVGGEELVANAASSIQWTATDPSGVAAVSLFLSLDEGVSFQPEAVGIPNTGVYPWIPAHRPSTVARIRVVAVDNAGNTGQAQSAASFSILSPPGGRVPTTLRDFDLPGTQPHEGGAPVEPAVVCGGCHGNYDTSVEPYENWQGSMMALASRDLLFEASLAVANQDAPDSGDLCLRCHIYAGWVQGRSVPTDGSGMLVSDLSGVSCELCHRLVNPSPREVDPPGDLAILESLSIPPTAIANGMLVLDPAATRRGPFDDAFGPHPFTVSPFHREAALCGTCHDVSNPVFERTDGGDFPPGPFDQAASGHGPHELLAVERTYSEWLHSDYNTPEGVLAPAFAGNKADGSVATCQDCHLRDVEGPGAHPGIFPSTPVRPDLPLHDMTGGSTWLPTALASLYPDEISASAVQHGVDRALNMLTNAATLSVHAQGEGLVVRIINETGHKLPTGYPEGRRMWVQVAFLDATGTTIETSGGYDPTTGILAADPPPKIYEVKPGLSTDLAAALDLPAGPSFHFVLNDTVFKDNRIPPRGFTRAAFASFGGQPVGADYADGQYWDDTYYSLPPGTTRVKVRLLYQSTTREFVEFLREENATNDRGQLLQKVWDEQDKCPPVLMAETAWSPASISLGATFDPEGRLLIQFLSEAEAVYTIEYTDALEEPGTWNDFISQGTLVGSGNLDTFIDDFTEATSGGPSASGLRFYRLRAETP